jgi:hypothetical protein
MSLGRNVSSTDGELVIDLNEAGQLQFWDYSVSTGYGFSTHNAMTVATGTLMS